jgi:tetratricopeptide (TPR) repeat protein
MVLLALAAGIAYANSLDGLFIFDDSRIYYNTYIRIASLDWHSLSTAFLRSEPTTRPVANLSFALNYYLHGYRVWGYHLVNLLIHLSTGCFLYLLIITTLATPGLRSYRDRCHADPHRFAPEWLAFFAALLWLLHPVQTQSVSYVVQRMNSMAAMFYIISLFLYVRGRQQAGGGWKAWLLFGGSILAGAFAIGSKETAVTLPAFILLYEWYFLEDLDSKWLRNRALPVALVVALIVLLGVLLLDGHPVERILGSYQGRSFTLGQRLLTELRVLFFYLGLLLLPLPSWLSLDHDFPVSTSLLQPPTTLAALVGLLLLVALALWSARRQRLLSFAILWFLGNLVVESSLVGLELVFEHRLYLPSMLLFVIAVLGLDRLLHNRLGKTLLLVGLAGLLCFWTVERNRAWHDPMSLWSDAVAKAPGKARAHNNLGVALRERGRLQEAAEQYREVIRLDPGFIEAYNNLANVEMDLGHRDEALRSYYQALQLNPNHPVIHNNIGRLLLEEHRYDLAVPHFAEAARIMPGYAEAKENLLYARIMLNTTRQATAKQ